jgi:hypothetical protein
MSANPQAPARLRPARPMALSRTLVRIEDHTYGTLTELLHQRTDFAEIEQIDRKSDRCFEDARALIDAVAAECPEYARPLRRAADLIGQGLKLDDLEETALVDAALRNERATVEARAIAGLVERAATGRGREVEIPCAVHLSTECECFGGPGEAA